MWDNPSMDDPHPEKEMNSYSRKANKLSSPGTNLGGWTEPKPEGRMRAYLNKI